MRTFLITIVTCVTFFIVGFLLNALPHGNAYALNMVTSLLTFFLLTASLPLSLFLFKKQDRKSRNTGIIIFTGALPIVLCYLGYIVPLLWGNIENGAELYGLFNLNASAIVFNWATVWSRVFELSALTYYASYNSNWHFRNPFKNKKAPALD